MNEQGDGANGSLAAVEAEVLALFGTPIEPRYRVLDAWQEPELDPNRSARAELGPSDVAAMRESNAIRFAPAIAAIRKGDFESAHLPANAIELLLRIRDRARELPRAARDPAVCAEVEGWILDWYPSLAESSELYRVQCANCHGTYGAGDGWQAATLDPKPRDFRRAAFKFTSRLGKAKPAREDLRRVFERGLPGSSMPSFQRFSRAELEGLVDYVRWLALRGSVERDLLLTLEEEGELEPGYALETYQAMWEAWLRSADKTVPVPAAMPDATPERVARGEQLFRDATKGNCAQCHGETGRGDGFASFTVDETGARQPIRDDWGQPIKPRDLVEGVFRGGREPIDVYRRIYAGINGTPMPAIGETKTASGEPLLDEDDLWCLTFYTLSLRDPKAAR